MDTVRLPDPFFLSKPFDHQRKALEAALSLDHGYGFFFGVGAGKTFTAINAVRYRVLEAKRPLKIFVCSPVLTLGNWKEEFLKFSKIKDIEIASGDKAKRAYALSKNPQVIISNHEAVGRVQGFTEEIIKWAPDICIWDESQRLKDVKAKQTKNAIKIADTAKYNYCLSATPLLNSYLDLYSQIRLIDKGKTFGKSFYTFRAKYFVDRNAGSPSHVKFQDWKPRKESRKELHDKVKDLCTFVKTEDCIDLPPLIKVKIIFDLSSEQQKAYNNMAKDLIHMLSDKEAIVSPLVLTKHVRLRQIISGFAGTETESGEKNIFRFKENPRRVALKQLLEKLTPEHKCTVWAVFKEDFLEIKKVCEELKLKFVEIHGDVPQEEKHKRYKHFEATPSVKVFIGHPKSGGIGINLISASCAIFYSRDYSYENDEQAMGRNRRNGSQIHSKIIRYDLVANETIDIGMLGAVANKERLSPEILKRDLGVK